MGFNNETDGSDPFKNLERDLTGTVKDSPLNDQGKAEKAAAEKAAAEKEEITKKGEAKKTSDLHRR